MPTEKTASIRIAVPSLWPGGPQASVGPDMKSYSCFTLLDISQGRLVLTTILADPPYIGSDCRVLAGYLADNDVQVIAVKKIEPCPMKTIKQNGIDVFMGSGYQVSDVVDSFRDEWPECVSRK